MLCDAGQGHCRAHLGVGRSACVSAPRSWSSEDVSITWQLGPKAEGFLQRAPGVRAAGQSPCGTFPCFCLLLSHQGRVMGKATSNTCSNFWNYYLTGAVNTRECPLLFLSQNDQLGRTVGRARSTPGSEGILSRHGEWQNSRPLPVKGEAGPSGLPSLGHTEDFESSQSRHLPHWDELKHRKIG